MVIDFKYLFPLFKLKIQKKLFTGIFALDLSVKPMVANGVDGKDGLNGKNGKDTLKGLAIAGTVIGGISLLGNIILVAYLLKKKN